MKPQMDTNAYKREEAAKTGPVAHWVDGFSPLNPGSSGFTCGFRSPLRIQPQP
jgi:hypothetical protein